MATPAHTHVSAALVAVNDTLVIDGIVVTIASIAQSSTGRILLTLADGREASVLPSSVMVSA